MNRLSRDDLAAMGCLSIPLVLIGLFLWGCATFGAGMMLGLVFIVVAGIAFGCVLVMASGGF